MPQKKPARKQPQPRVTPMALPGYVGVSARRKLLSWKWAEKRLKEGQTYWFSTSRPDGTPHLMPVWALWHDGLLYVSTGPQSRKALNLEKNAHCVIGAEHGPEAIVVEGIAARIPTASLDPKVLKLYKRKYDWDMTSLGNVVYAVRPVVVFGLNDKPEQATRWQFPAQ